MDIHHELITPELRTTSRVVAEKFGKRHANVLRDIDNLRKDAPAGFTELNFEFSTYLDSTGRTLPMVEMTRDGFVLLAMGFTGAAAMEWKVRFIEAFNMMEAELAADFIGSQLPTDSLLQAPQQRRVSLEIGHTGRPPDICRTVGVSNLHHSTNAQGNIASRHFVLAAMREISDSYR